MDAPNLDVLPREKHASNNMNVQKVASKVVARLVPNVIKQWAWREVKEDIWRGVHPSRIFGLLEDSRVEPHNDRGHKQGD